MLASVDLLEREKCREFLEFQKDRIKAPNLKVAASMVMKRYAKDYLDYTLPSILSDSEVKVIPITAINLSENLKFTVNHTMSFYVRKQSEGWKQLFAGHLTKIIMSLHNTTNLPLIILWENIAVRINSFFRKALDHNPGQTDMINTRFKELHELDGSYFDQNSHPMKNYLTPVESIGQQKIRSTCCYFHKLKKDKELPYCLVCPLTNK
ncbi:hypothetical protein [Aquibacillus kalidii]|uniref:hypothetical protein n=1 Tax=Aquibacillus kalidii TaxID=2762597 RepID=UPI0016482A89|nr:hypothetical protein [Aquibacillus kalidii]